MRILVDKMPDTIEECKFYQKVFRDNEEGEAYICEYSNYDYVVPCKCNVALCPYFKGLSKALEEKA